MQLQKTRNAVRNILFGVVYKAVAILGPFIVRTVILYVMGNEYVGLNSLFTSVLSFLSLAELGVGSALIYSMYKPIAENDHDMICALLNLYRKLYRYIGLIIFAIGCLLVPFLKYLVKDGIPDDVNLYALYFIYLGNTVISYWMFAYKQSLLTAFQRSDIISKRSMIVQLLMYIIQITMLILMHNYYLYIIWLPIFTVITNIANAVIVDKMFPQFQCRGEISQEQKRSITKKITALFGTKANSIIMHAADNVVISAFLGLTIVGKYGNYYYIMNAIVGVMTIIYDSITAGLGNSLETDTKEKIYRNFNMLSFLNSWLVTFCSVCLLCLYQPFMKLWVHEENMLGFDIVILLVIYFYLYQIRRIILTYKDAGGIWWEDRFRPYAMILINVTSNLILVQFIKLNGVIISTIFSMLVSIPWETYTVFRYIFHLSSKKYYQKLLLNALSCTGICALTWMICLKIPEGISGFILKGVVCVIVPNILYAVIYAKTEDFHASMKFVKERLIKRKV